jgi:hypothetical protein
VTFEAPSLAYRLIFRHRARSTHHKIALAALLNLRGPQARQWRDALLWQGDAYLRGAKAPDDVFRDSMNQVLHVRDGYWGGAPEAAQSWYQRLVERLRAQAWPDAAFAAGVLSHYWSDPIQPLHTGQTEAEGAVHRAIEQSIAKSWDVIIARLPQAPRIDTPEGPDWLNRMVRAGAELASPHYDLMIDHYDLAAGVKDPPAGLDDALRDALAQCIGHAVGGFAAILDRAFAEANIAPPKADLTLSVVMSILGIPYQAVLKVLEDSEERDIIKAQFAEFEATGKVVKTLSHDDRIVRAAHARDIAKMELADLDRLPARTPGQAHGKPATAQPETIPSPIPAPIPAPAPETARTIAAPIAVAAAPKIPEAKPITAPDRLPLSAPVVDAPAIGPMTAARLEAIGCHTVGDLLALDPVTAAQALKVRHIGSDEVKRWQAAARLYAAIRTLNQTEAYLLAAMGIENTDALARADAAPLAGRIAAFSQTNSGQRIVRERAPPNLADVQAWIAASKQAG